MNNFSTSDWLTLVRARGLGPATLLPLLKQTVTVETLLQSGNERTRKLLHEAFSGALQPLIDDDLIWLEQAQHHLITINDSRYPALLKEISDPPLALFVNGDPGLLALAQLAIVGSRNPTRQGLENAYNFAGFLAGHGVTITSGMAAGIDARAHAGALNANGQTVAVVGTGPDRIYPAGNKKLAHEIADEGAIVSEFPPGTQPSPGNFPRRNRIISGLSVGTLVVEATIRSGSLITARLAAEQGREVFAIPGSIHSPQSRGCHKIIRDGARLVETAEDIICDLGAIFTELAAPVICADAQPPAAENTAENMDKEYLSLLDCMGWDPVTTDELIHSSGLPAQTVSSMLLLLELQGHVSSASGGYFVRCQLANHPG